MLNTRNEFLKKLVDASAEQYDHRKCVEDPYETMSEKRTRVEEYIK